ncbi:MAG: hypothetical protein U0797_29585 [Gemmataceae bacterium]
MRRRATCRLILGLLLGGVAACGSPAPPHTVEVPTNRFPKAGLPAKKDAPKERSAVR